MLYAQTPDGPWAVVIRSPVFADAREESAQILSHYGGNVEGLGYVLHNVPMPLPAARVKWSTERDMPAADIGPGTPVLIAVNGAAQLALFWDFESSRAYATTYRGTHVTLIAPALVDLIELVSWDGSQV